MLLRSLVEESIRVHPGERIMSDVECRDLFRGSYIFSGSIVNVSWQQIKAGAWSDDSYNPSYIEGMHIQRAGFANEAAALAPTPQSNKPDKMRFLDLPTYMEPALVQRANHVERVARRIKLSALALTAALAVGLGLPESTTELSSPTPPTVTSAK